MTVPVWKVSAAEYLEVAKYGCNYVEVILPNVMKGLLCKRDGAEELRKVWWASRTKHKSCQKRRVAWLRSGHVTGASDAVAVARSCASTTTTVSSFPPPVPVAGAPCMPLSTSLEPLSL